ncbi:YkvA family protein [Flavobacterium sp. RHBU_3]|uniref:YkvA family protein n=1 Tax=Flavobacterium sp. RHBU_3 TaxID=3391184 RepID=UPI003984B282
MDENNRNKVTWASVLAVLSVVYAISPADIIPDIPVVGWIDDFFIVSAAGLNLLEKTTDETHQTLKKILKTLKWIVIVLGILVILLVLLLGTLLYNVFSH